MRMRVLQVSRRFYPYVGGIESVVLGVCNALIADGHTSDVLTLQSPSRRDLPLAAHEEFRGIDIYRVPAFGSARYRVAPGCLRYLSSYDVLHIHSLDFFADFLSWTRWIHRKPLVVSTHGAIFHTSWMSAFKRAYFSTVTHLSLRGVQAVLCDSEHDYRLLQDIVVASKLRVVPNGVDLRPFLEIRKAIKPGLLVGVGRIAHNKGIDRLLQVLSLTPDGPDSARLLWIGKDEDGLLASLRQEADRLGVAHRVTWGGGVAQDDLCLALSRAHLYVAPSQYEAFGVATIEAMASGTVPFVSPVGIHPNAISEGQNGYLVSFDDSVAAARKLAEAMAEPISRVLQMGEAARQSVRAFSWDSISAEYLSVYQGLQKPPSRSVCDEKSR
jgi:alpha-1,3-mannosyltransferase